MGTNTTVAPVDEVLPVRKLGLLGLQHVLVMYAGAVAVPLIVGRALQLTSAEISLLIAADLFVCGIVTVMQSLGATQWLGIRLPVMMGVTFAAVGPMVSMANSNPGHEGAQLLFGTVIGAGIVTILIVPIVSRMLRFFPPVVTGTIIAMIGITLMRVGINWIFGNPVGPTAPQLVDPSHAEWLATISNASDLPTPPSDLKLAATLPNPRYATLQGLSISAIVLVSILLIARYCKGFLANVAVLLGIVIGAVIATFTGLMTFEKVAAAPYVDLILPFHFGMPKFSFIHIATMSLVMVVVLIESTGMFLALSDMTGKKISQRELAAGLRVDGVGTILGGIFNTFPYSSFSQNVGLVAVTGIRSRFVCVAAGVILIILGLLPKMAALVESLPTVVLGGAGIVMFGMVTATGIRILSQVNYTTNRNNAMIVAVSIGVGMIPLVAPHYKQWMPSSLGPIIESGIILTSIAAVVLNLFFNGLNGTSEDHVKEPQEHPASE